MKTSTPVLRLLLASSALATLVACGEPKDPKLQAALRYETCLPCHGPAGEGRADLQAPPIAGLPAWYVESQLAKFRSGWRGTHPEDLAGMRMRPMSLTLPTEADVKAMADHVASLPGGAPHPATLEGADAARGQAVYGPCVACHGVDGSGNEGLKAPPIAGKPDWYVFTQVKHVKSGVRGGNPADVQGALMRPFTAALDEQAMKDVAAYIHSMARK